MKNEKKIPPDPSPGGTGKTHWDRRPGGGCEAQQSVQFWITTVYKNRSV